MGRYTRFYQQTHCTYACEYHLVWSTRYREEMLSAEYTKRELRKILLQICKWKGFQIRAWHIGSEHVHLYLTIPPRYSISYAVGILKGKSSAWMKRKVKKLELNWNRGYFISTLGMNEIAIKRYIESHGKRFKDVAVKMDI